MHICLLRINLLAFDAIAENGSVHTKLISEREIIIVLTKDF